jgi:hypothetical protein
LVDAEAWLENGARKEIFLEFSNEPFNEQEKARGKFAKVGENGGKENRFKFPTLADGLSSFSFASLRPNW